MKIALVGATGLVGSQMVKMLEQYMANMIDDFIPVASASNVGKPFLFNGKTYHIKSLQEAVDASCNIALFSAGGEISKEWAPQFVMKGCTVIDNSSAWRMHPKVPLVVPEINSNSITSSDRIIANPNCSTIQLTMVLAPLNKIFKIKRVVISTYQSITGSGIKAVQQLERERNGDYSTLFYPHIIDKNCIPQCDVFSDDDYTKEELKIINETKKILNDDTIQVTATAVRVPVVGGHSESVNIEFESNIDLNRIKQILKQTKGVVTLDDVNHSIYPMPINAHEKDEVFVGRIRIDRSRPNSINLWIVADNLRKGAATNAVQIAAYLIDNDLL